MCSVQTEQRDKREENGQPVGNPLDNSKSGNPLLDNAVHGGLLDDVAKDLQKENVHQPKTEPVPPVKNDQSAQNDQKKPVVEADTNNGNLIV